MKNSKLTIIRNLFILPSALGITIFLVIPYVLETKKTVLGNELIAKKQEVMVLDKNETQIAVEGIGSETEVITSYTKSLNEGDTVQKYDE